MSYEIYKIIHLVGIVLLFSGLVGLLTIRMSGGKLEGPAKSLVMSAHGIGLLLLLVGGFGLMAKLNIARDIPNWIFVKLVIWLLMGGALTFVKRKGQIGWPLFISLILIFIIAASFAIYKPF